MSKILYKFDDFIDKIEAKVKPPLHKTIAFLFMPRSLADAVIRWFILLFAIVGVYSITYIPINRDFSDHKISGKISALRVGYYGSGNVKFSGNSEVYYFKIDGYKSTFFINNMGSFYGNGALSKWMFEKGNRIETTITRSDYKRVLKETPLPKGSKFPNRSDCIRIYGVTVNGEKINSKYASLFSVSYYDNFWWLIPLYIYFIMLSVILGIMIQATYSDRKRRKGLFTNK